MINYSLGNLDLTNEETYDKIKNCSKKWLTAITYYTLVLFKFNLYVQIRNYLCDSF